MTGDPRTLLLTLFLLFTGTGVAFWAGAQWSTNRWLRRIRELLIETKKEFHPDESLPWIRERVMKKGWKDLRTEFEGYYQRGSRAEKIRQERREERDHLVDELQQKLVPPPPLPPETRDESP